jgi:hypothetical protein
MPNICLGFEAGSQAVPNAYVPVMRMKLSGYEAEARAAVPEGQDGMANEAAGGHWVSALARTGQLAWEQFQRRSGPRAEVPRSADDPAVPAGELSAAWNGCTRRELMPPDRMWR